MTRLVLRTQALVCTAGQETIFAMPGEQFLLMSCTGTVDIVAQNRDSEVVAELSDVPAGINPTIAGGYARLVITSPITQTVRVAHSSADVDLAGIVGLANVTLSALQPLDHDGSTAVDGTGITITPPAGATVIQLTADPGNSDMIWPSGTVGQGTPVQPGQTISWPVGSAINPKAGSGTQSLYWSIFGP